jgi:hypothetical protein
MMNMKVVKMAIKMMIRRRWRRIKRDRKDILKLCRVLTWF